MKTLYQFEIKKQIEVEEPIVKTGEDGKEIKVLEKVKKDEPHKFYIKKPSRALFDDADLFYGVVKSEGIRAGLLPRALLIKRFLNDGGALSEDENKSMTTVFEDFDKKLSEYQRLNLKEATQKNEEEKAKQEVLLKELVGLQGDIEDFELKQNDLFKDTAEHRAKVHAILWWVLNISYMENGKAEPVPFFGEGDFKQKQVKYDDFIENEADIRAKGDEYLLEALKKFSYLISFWYSGKAAKFEDFKVIDEAIF